MINRDRLIGASMCIFYTLTKNFTVLNALYIFTHLKFRVFSDWFYTLFATKNVCVEIWGKRDIWGDSWSASGVISRKGRQGVGIGWNVAVGWVRGGMQTVQGLRHQILNMDHSLPYWPIRTLKIAHCTRFHTCVQLAMLHIRIAELVLPI